MKNNVFGGYLGINKMLDKVKVSYWRVTIFQVAYLKGNFEEIGIRIDKVTLSSIHAINMYPPIKIATIKKTVRYFLKVLTVVTKNTINLCLETIRFRVISTLIYFYGQYYKYHGGR